MRFRTGFLTCGAMLAAAAVGGQAGATGFASYFALVAAAGSTIKGSGVSASSKTAVGTYNVTFARAVNDCAHTATLRGAGAGLVAVGPKAGSPTVVAVTTFSSAGVKQDRAFNLSIQCNS